MASMTIEGPSIRALRQLCRGMSVKGLAGFVKSAECRSDTLARYLDVPHELVLDAARRYPAPRRPGLLVPPGLKSVLRGDVEAHLLQIHHLGPKWAAVAHGLTEDSLRELLGAVARDSGRLAEMAHVLLTEWREGATLDPSIHEALMTLLCQFDGPTIFASLPDRTRYLGELASRRWNVDLETVPDANAEWLKALNPRVRLEEVFASTFCAFTGLPISHGRAEYLNAPKPPAVGLDHISWLALAENPSLRDWTITSDWSQAERFWARAARRSA
jgi:hypothetical protein